MKKMTLAEKKSVISAITTSLENSHKEVTSVGTMFYVAWSYGTVQRDINYREFKNHGILVDILDYTSGYFSGSKEKAEALAEAFGGSARASEYCSYVPESACPIWVWESPNRHLLEPYHQHPVLVDLEEAKEVIALA